MQNNSQIGFDLFSFFLYDDKDFIRILQFPKFHCIPKFC